MSVSVPTPESLSMDCGLKCDMCNESVNYGDDYIAHLQFAHQIVKNIPFFMDKALKTIKGEKRKIADDDVVTIEEEDVEDSIEGGVDSTFELDPATKSNIERTVENTMDDLFKDIKLMVEGKIPLDVDENSSDTQEDEDPYAADEKIWQSFENLKQIVNNMEFPVELLQQLSSSMKGQREEVENDKTEEPLAELVIPSPPTVENNQDFRRPQETQKNNRTAAKDIPTNLSIPPPTPPANTRKPKPSPKPAPASVNQPNNSKLSPKLPPIKSDQSDLSTASSTGPSSSMQTSFLCPVENCSFSTTKQGMMGGAAASHLSKTHKITGADMKTAAPGKYKFKKVKRETKS
eukprot:GFUD01007756.1.p1 GENE.GFUD01007756.1~~GFUD01007756.1.p1  ORF type:complete len:347 (+),score=127.83 GFUD01007756.1:63-1103(+)